MYPELFSVGPFNIHTFGLMLALGFVASWWVMVKLYAFSGRDPNQIGNFMTVMMVSGVAGARIADVIERWQIDFAGKPFLDNLVEIVRLDHGGLMFYGGLILAAITFLVYCAVKRINVFELGDVITVVLPLGHTFGRIGCFMNGCCHGGRTDGIFGVVFPVRSPAWEVQVHEGLINRYATTALPVIPTQLFEAAGNLLIFAVLLYCFLQMKRRQSSSRHTGLIMGAYAILYGMLRFATEFTRGDYRPEFGMLSIGQIISIALVGVGAVIIFYVKIHADRSKIVEEEK